MSRIYAAGAAMGWPVNEVDRTSMWKFWAAWNGYVKANGPAQSGKLSEAEKDMLWADIEAWEPMVGLLSTQVYQWDGHFVPQGRVAIK